MSFAITVVGPGLIGTKHISLIRENPCTDLVAIVAPDSSRSRSIAMSEDVTFYSDLAICLANEHVDAVIVASPNEFHFEQGRLCIERQIPVLIEKPITSNISDAAKLVDLVSRHNSKVLVGHHRLYSPLLSRAQHVILSGLLGRLVTVVGSAQFFKPSAYFRDGPWRTKVGGGPILINLIHEISNLRALMGEISYVQAVASCSVRRFDVEDTVAINFVFENGALGTFILSDTAATPMSWEQTSGENLAYPNYTDVDCYIISGTLGCLNFPTFKLRYFSSNSDASWLNPFEEDHICVDRADPLRKQFEHFVDVIAGNEEPRVSVVEGYRNLLVIDAIRRAIVSGQKVQVLS